MLNLNKMKLHHTQKKLFISATIGILAAIVVTCLDLAKFAPLVAWDVSIIIYVVWIWTTVLALDPSDTKSHAVREDPGRAIADVLLLFASIVSLVAVVFLIAQAGHASGITKTIDIVLGLASVIVSWFLVHTTYALKYARLYYIDPSGGVDFNEDDLPKYTDFAYLAFTTGMTSQVSDTNIKTKEIRVAALKHSLLSFLFNTIIIASTINAMVSLS